MPAYYISYFYWKVEMNTVRKLLKIDCIEEKGIIGKDIVVAILDTGMAEHPDLKEKIILFKDLGIGKNVMTIMDMELTLQG